MEEDREIAPVTIPQRKGAPKIVGQDEHPRATTPKALAKLPTPFRESGSVTAGNASGVTDGAVALIVASEEAAKRLGLTPIARILALQLQAIHGGRGLLHPASRSSCQDRFSDFQTSSSGKDKTGTNFSQL